jgi:hypothetical protein
LVNPNPPALFGEAKRSQLAIWYFFFRLGPCQKIFPWFLLRNLWFTNCRLKFPNSWLYCIVFEKLLPSSAREQG